MEASAYHGVRAVSTAGVQLLTTQRDLIYTAHAETRVRNLGRNKTALGLTVSRLVEEGGPPTKARTRACPLLAAPCEHMLGAWTPACIVLASSSHAITPKAFGANCCRRSFAGRSVCPRRRWPAKPSTYMKWLRLQPPCVEF